MEVVIQPLGRTLKVERGANLLDTLRAEGVPVSHSCMAGRCGTCRCRVLAGEVLESGREVKRNNLDDDGYVLACMSVLTEPCTIEIPEPDEIVMHPARILKAKVSSIEKLTHDVVGVKLKLAKPLDYSPGQYVTLQFTPQHIRPYSMAGLADDLTLEFHVRLIPDGLVSGYVANELKEGAPVRVTGPLGTAYLRKKHDGPMLCVAGGTGLAPILSIVRGAIANTMRNPIHVYFGVNTPDDAYQLDVLESLAREHDNIHVHVVVTAGQKNGQFRRGLVTDAVDADWNDLSDFRAYLCGSPPMVEAATLLVTQKGLAPEHVYADAFYPSAT